MGAGVAGDAAVSAAGASPHGRQRVAKRAAAAPRREVARMASFLVIDFLRWAHE
jgi:hypothetical protein